MSIDEEYLDLIQRTEAFIDVMKAYDGPHWLNPSLLVIGVKPHVELSDTTLQLVGDVRLIAQTLVHAITQPAGQKLLVAISEALAKVQATQSANGS